MPVSIDDALRNPFISLVQRQDGDGIYEVRIGAIETVVTITLRRTWGDFGPTAYRTSHAIYTPGQVSPYWPTNRHAGTPGTALHEAITGLTQHYVKAIKDNHEPSETWLVPSEAVGAPVSAEGPRRRAAKA